MDLMFYIKPEARSCAASEGLALMENLRVDVAREAEEGGEWGLRVSESEVIDTG